MYICIKNKVRVLVNCLCMNKKKWFKVQVKTVLRCDTSFKCLCLSSFSLENKNT